MPLRQNKIVSLKPHHAVCVCTCACVWVCVFSEIMKLAGCLILANKGQMLHSLMDTDLHAPMHTQTSSHKHTPLMQVFKRKNNNFSLIEVCSDQLLESRNCHSLIGSEVLFLCLLPASAVSHSGVSIEMGWRRREPVLTD